MSMALWMLIVFIIILAGGLVYYTVSRSNSAQPDVMMEKEEQSMMTEEKGDEEMMAGEDKMMGEDDESMADEATDTMMKDDAMMEKTSSTDSMMKSDGPTSQSDQSNGDLMTAGSYVEYSPATYAAAADKKRVLFFHATWCPTCKAANANFEDNLGKIPANVVLLKTDYDTETALKQKYGVTYQHTFVQVDAAGNAVTKWNGGGIEELIGNII